MPLGSISEWRSRIGSSWCALGRPFKTRSPFRGGAGRLQTPLTLNQVVTMIVILMIFTAINIAFRIVWTTGHYRAYLGGYRLTRKNSKLVMIAIIINAAVLLHVHSGLFVSWLFDHSKIIGLIFYQSLHHIITHDTLSWILGMTIVITIKLKLILW